MSHVHQLAYSYGTSSAEISVIRTELSSVHKRKSRPASQFSFSRCCRLGRVGAQPFVSLAPSRGRCRRHSHLWIRGSRRPMCARLSRNNSVALRRRVSLSRRSPAPRFASYLASLRDWHLAPVAYSWILRRRAVLRPLLSGFLVASLCAFRSLCVLQRHLAWRSACRCGLVRVNLLDWPCSHLRCGSLTP